MVHHQKLSNGISWACITDQLDPISRRSVELKLISRFFPSINLTS
jgi:hypothetical protein